MPTAARRFPTPRSGRTSRWRGSSGRRKSRSTCWPIRWLWPTTRCCTPRPRSSWIRTGFSSTTSCRCSRASSRSGNGRPSLLHPLLALLADRLGRLWVHALSRQLLQERGEPRHQRVHGLPCPGQRLTHLAELAHLHLGGQRGGVHHATLELGNAAPDGRRAAATATAETTSDHPTPQRVERGADRVHPRPEVGGGLFGVPERLPDLAHPLVHLVEGVRRGVRAAVQGVQLRGGLEPDPPVRVADRDVGGVGR